MDEHDVEGAAEPERSHVSLEVLALGIERAAQREHVGREVGERADESRLQVRRVVAAARAELEERLGRAVHRLVDDPGHERRLVPVVGRVRQEVEPRREVGVHVHPAPRECTKAAEAAFPSHALERT